MLFYNYLRLEGMGILMDRRTNKTASVMRLLTGSGTAANPMLDEEFKKEVIVPREKELLRNNGREVVINITSELISKWLPEALKRFGCCCCDLCLAEASVEAFDRIPPLEIRIKSDKDLKKAEKLKADNLSKVMMTLVQIAVERKKLKKHK